MKEDKLVCCICNLAFGTQEIHFKFVNRRVHPNGECWRKYKNKYRLNWVQFQRKKGV